MASTKNGYLWMSLAVIAITIILSVATYNRWWDLRFEVGPVYFSHLLGWIGFAFIAIYTPIYSYAKRRSRGRTQFLLNMHNLGNLSAMLLISLHFAQQVGSPAEFYPTLGTGLALYISVCVMAITGMLMRFRFAKRLAKRWRFIHTGFVLPFYVVILIHILHGLGIT